MFITSPKTLEPILAQELSKITNKPLSEFKVRRAGVAFLGTLEDAYRVALHSRVANRVLLELDHFEADSTSRLYAGIKKIRWSEHMTPDHTLAVDFTKAIGRQPEAEVPSGPRGRSFGGALRSERVGLQDFVSNTMFGAQKTKDAICDQFVSIQGSRPSVDVENPGVRVHVHLDQNQVSVYIDLSGESLHRRGYRKAQSEAPLKENLAAALLMMAEWPELTEQATPELGFVDLMCGSGTFLFEAVLMAGRIPPRWASSRPPRFGFETWTKHDPKLWAKICDETRAACILDPKRLPRFYGFDKDAFALGVAKENLRALDPRLADCISLKRRSLDQTEPPSTSLTKKGLVVLNPPYGVRLEEGDIEKLKGLYREIGHQFKKNFSGWTGYLLAPHGPLTHEVGLKAERRFEAFNGTIECRWLRFRLQTGGFKKKEKLGPKS